MIFVAPSTVVGCFTTRKASALPSTNQHPLKVEQRPLVHHRALVLGVWVAKRICDPGGGYNVIYIYIYINVESG